MPGRGAHRVCERKAPRVRPEKLLGLLYYATRGQVQTTEHLSVRRGHSLGQMPEVGRWERRGGGVSSCGPRPAFPRRYLPLTRQ